MPKIGRNEPCPCGSGKKYKYCCGKDDNIIPFPVSSQKQNSQKDKFTEHEELLKDWDGTDSPTFMEMQGKPNKATKQLKELQEILDGKDFGSVEEYQQFFQNYNKGMNTRPIDDFLGLSPEQMYNMLNKPFEENQDILILNIELEEQDIRNIPVMVQLKYFLEGLNELSPLKATAKGNLPRKFVLELYDNIYEGYAPNEYRFKINKEEDDLLICSHRHILTMAGIIKKVKNNFSLTKKGKVILENQDYNGLYETVFKTYLQKYNWAFTDGYSELHFIQRFIIFNLFILKMKAKEFTEGKELGEIFLQAFPDLAREASLSFKEPGEEIIDCFESRFLRRFGVPFGFLEERKEGKGILERKYYYQTTHWFERCFEWNV